jgi:putative tryptophan/tyrosine transport system substrate-binding protein
MSGLGRREFVALLGGAAAAWPLAADAALASEASGQRGDSKAQQSPMPAIGFLSSGSQQSDAWRLAAFRRGLNEAGYLEGRNVVAEFRWADEQYDRLPALAAELVQRQPAVIVALGGPAPALAAKAASTTIPIVFAIAGEPVKLGLVASINRPGGNATGVSTLFSSVVAKQFETLREVVPKAMVIGCVVNPGNPNAATGTREAHEAARALGLDVRFVNASTEREIDMAFPALVQDRVDALVVVTDPLFNSRPEQLSTLAARYALPTIYPYREFATAGGLISYGGTLTQPWYLAGTYAGRILKGERAADLPVQQTTKVTLVINLKTAKALGLEIPPTLLARADAVIE